MTDFWDESLTKEKTSVCNEGNLIKRGREQIFGHLTALLTEQIY